MKKFLVLIMVLCLIITATACTTVVTPTTAPTSGAATPTPGQTIVTLTCWNPTSLQSGRTLIKQMDTKIGKLIAEQTGVAFDTTFITGDPEIAFNLKLASNSWEDIIQIGKNNIWVQKLIDSKVIEPIDAYLTMADKYPNLAAISDNVKKNFTYTDGKIYYFPSFWYEKEDSVYGYWCAEGWYVLPEILTAVNMKKEDLATMTGVETFLGAVKAANLKNADGLSIIPLASSADLAFKKVFINTYGVSTAKDGWDIYDGKLINSRQHPNTKLAYAEMNKLFRMGVMDPELTTLTNDMLVERLSAKRVAMIPDMAWPFWGAVTGGPTNVTELTYIPFPKVDGVTKVGISQTYNAFGNSGWLLTAACKNKDAVAKAADWGEAKGKYRGWEAYYGPRGTMWDWGSQGEPTFKLVDPELETAQKSGDYKKMEDLGYSTVAMVWPFDLDLNYFNDAVQESLFWIFGMHKFNATQGYTTKDRPIDQTIISGEGAWATNSATINDLDKQYATKLVTATSDAAFNAAWAEYQDKLNTMGKFADVQKEFQAAYDAQIK